MQNVFQAACFKKSGLMFMQQLSDALYQLKKSAKEKEFKQLIDEIEDFTCRKLRSNGEKQGSFKVGDNLIMYDFVSSKERLSTKNIN